MEQLIKILDKRIIEWRSLKDDAQKKRDTIESLEYSTKAIECMEILKIVLELNLPKSDEKV